ncbi:MAG: ArsA family ATPase [Actinobacteria bacterium]|nr:ArsA family ATPase [Actinomycetota bacterium]MCW3045171.1 ArsA family ATPase [Actinomycetota bacterium]
MSLDAILDRRLLIISGKGGVGKTTIAAALGVMAARHDLRVLVAEIEGKNALSSLLAAPPLTSEPRELRPGLWAMHVSPEEALSEYFEVQFHAKRVVKPLVTSQLVYYVTHAAPGLRDILMLGKIWYQVARKGEFDLAILDTPAAGHAVSMLRSPEGFLEAVPVGTLAGHARRVSDWLHDPEQVAVHLVSLAEETPVKETLETTRLLEERVHMNVDRVHLNMLYPPFAEDPAVNAALDRLKTPRGLRPRTKDAPPLSDQRAQALFACGEFYRDRRAIQQEHRQTLIDGLDGTASVIDLPFLFGDGFAGKELDLLADVIEDQA